MNFSGPALFVTSAIALFVILMFSKIEATPCGLRNIPGISTDAETPGKKLKSFAQWAGQLFHNGSKKSKTE
ncbi:hypothetical protein O181_026654 [Austropuccinia psidii MF-1]|uniref:Secreted protein n=1 Tax=Austropuccinia psidii MF-1 TaxID=1389203 RepID=A0A9Q3H1U2_9BASI|nr:hypothetical protein [Austropuccinia psidii MF-1]